MTTYNQSSYNKLETPAGLVGEAPDPPGDMARLRDQIDARLGIGGAEYCPTTTARDAIPTSRLFKGKLAYVAADDIVYRCYDPSGANWAPYHSTVRNYTPIVNNLTLGNGTLIGSYQYTSGVLQGWISLVAGSATTASATLLFNLPTSAPDADLNYPHVANGYILDASANAQQGVYGSLDNARRFLLLTTANGTVVSQSTPFAIGTGDQYRISFRTKP